MSFFLLLAVCCFGFYLILSHLRTQAQLFRIEVSFMIGIAEVLASVAEVSDAFDTFLAGQGGSTPVDLQPAVDALDSLKAKIVAATPASPFSANGTVR